MKFKSNIELQSGLKDSSGAVGTSGQLLSSTGTGVSWASLNGFVPYTGATQNVDLGIYTLLAKDLVINHSSGSGVAASITKGGNGEALTVVKSSGSGNAASITGGVTLLSELNLTTYLADDYIASAATWNGKQNALSGTGIVKSVSGTISYLTDNSTNWNTAFDKKINSAAVTGTTTKTLTLTQQDGGTITADWTDIGNNLTFTSPLVNTAGVISIPAASGSVNGFLSSTDWTTFNAKQNALSGTGFVKISGTTISYDNSTYALDNVVVKLTGNQSITGTKTFNVSTATDAILVNNTGGRGLRILNETGSLFGLIINNSSTANATPFAIQKSGVTVFSISDAGLASASNGTLIGGTGTTNYLPKYTGTTTIGNSQIFDNGTNVGIGTLSAFSKVEIAGAATSWANSPAITFTDNAGTVNSRRWLIGNVATDYGSLNFAVSTTNSDNPTNPKMTITKEGNVGIGTTSPSTKLDVNGHINVTSAAINFGGSGSALSTDPAIYRIGGANDLAFAIGSTERMRIFSSGNVFIGSSPTDAGYRLDVNGSSRVNGDSFFSTSSRSGGIGIGTTTLKSSNVDSNILQFYNNGFIQNIVGNQMMVSNNAYLGPGGWTYSTANPAAAIRFGAQAAGDISFHSASGGAAGSSISNWDTSDIRMYIAPSGNVGIGTSSPGVKLQVNGSTLSTSTLNSTNGSFSIDHPGTQTWKIGITNSNTSTFSIGNDNGGAFAAKVFNITNVGNVGIGTISPNRKLSVVGGSNNGIVVQGFGGATNTNFTGLGLNTGFNVSYITSNNAAGSLTDLYIEANNFIFSTPAGERMRITSGGNVLITEAATFSSSVTATAFFASSDIRLKDIISTDGDMITYKWKDGRDNKTHVGYIAQDIQKTMPDAVNEGEDGMLSVNYIEVLVKKIQELENRIKQLEK